MNWNNCFSSERYGIEDPAMGARSEYERDWDRIIFSSAFRRLQNKTQVFPLPEEVFVHNRLTHSLEVSSVGRSLGKIVGKEISKLSDVESNSFSKDFYSNHLQNVIASACLAHDLGNPAFGHSGEEAISKFFIDREADEEFKKQFLPKEWADLISFEGNSNALRILTKQFHGRLPGGFRLTYSTLGAILKYPCESIASMGKKGPKHRAKYGFFQSDQNVFFQVATKLNMIHEENEYTVYKRHPFVYLVEAADDICYNIIDLEDAHRLDIFKTEKIENLFLKIIVLNQEENIETIKNTLKLLENDPNEKIAYLRAKAINYLALRCSAIFIENSESIISGTFNGDLLSEITEAKEIIKEIQDISYESIYNYSSVVKIELAGFRIMSGLIEDFVQAALVPVEKRQKLHKKALSLLPSQYKFEETDSPYEKVMCIIDFISGMTDLYALKLYRNLRGIEIPTI
jgi:dGTPase